jgi:hypothetical protein
MVADVERWLLSYIGAGVVAPLVALRVVVEAAASPGVGCRLSPSRALGGGDRRSGDPIMMSLG